MDLCLEERQMGFQARRALKKLVIKRGVVFGVVCVLLCLSVPAFRAAEPIPAEISDDVFWKMVTEMSEPDGYFQFENFLSNELGYQYVIPRLVQNAKPGGVYLGVGPEQNFTWKRAESIETVGGCE
jgi:hypothetical protein